jgi:hypothetical protein
MTTFLWFLAYLAVLMVAVPVIVCASVKLGVIGYHVGTRKAAEVLKRMEQGHAR